MQLKNYLNIGCGGTFHQSWKNIDMNINSPYVQSHNLLKGLPYHDNSFDVIYHSQVLEHFSKEDAVRFISECYRILNSNGILRVVVPDLENIAREYLELLQENLTNPSNISRANYDWILLEMYDQAVRNDSGGMMGKYLQDPNIVNRQYIEGRLGFIGKGDVDEQPFEGFKQRVDNFSFQKFYRFILRKFKSFHFTKTQKVGAFRFSGEIHQWMYDRFSLNRLLTEAGFIDIEIVDAHTSSINDWAHFELDVINGHPRNPASLYMEARKL